MRYVAFFLFTHYHTHVCMQQVSQCVNLSESHLCHLFRREVGVSPHKFLNGVRLQHAAELLATTFLSVKEVMARVGFNDPSHFVREFGKKFGESPRAYRSRRQRIADFANAGPLTSPLDSME